MRPHSSYHRAEIMESSICGCYHCQTVFAPTRIMEWVDKDQTALCPLCGIDAVIGNGSGHKIKPQVLRTLHNRWFKQTPLSMRMWVRLPLWVRRRLNRVRLTLAIWRRTRQAVRARVPGHEAMSWRRAWQRAGVLDSFDVTRTQIIPSIDALREDFTDTRAYRQQGTVS